MQNIEIAESYLEPRTYPTFAKNLDTQQLFLVFRVHNGKDAVLWALNMNMDGERFKFDDAGGRIELLPVGTTVHLIV